MPEMSAPKHFASNYINNINNNNDCVGSEGIVPVRVPGDGNCFYHALAHQLQGTALGHLGHEQLRLLVADGAENAIQRLSAEGAIAGDPAHILRLARLNCTAVPDEIPPLVGQILGIHLTIVTPRGQVLQQIHPLQGSAVIATATVMLENEHYNSVKKAVCEGQVPAVTDGDFTPKRRRLRDPTGNSKPYSLRRHVVDLDEDDDTDTPAQQCVAPCASTSTAAPTSPPPNTTTTTRSNTKPTTNNNNANPAAAAAPPQPERRASLRKKVAPPTNNTTKNSNNNNNNRNSNNNSTKPGNKDDKSLPECLQNPFDDEFLSVRREFEDACTEITSDLRVCSICEEKFPGLYFSRSTSCVCNRCQQRHKFSKTLQC
jgi:hypothetical protein